jgi:hypothetical protein
VEERRHVGIPGESPAERKPGRRGLFTLAPMWSAVIVVVHGLP